MKTRLHPVLCLSLSILLFVSACGSVATPFPTLDNATMHTQAAQTVVAELTQDAPLPTAPEPIVPPPPTTVPSLTPIPTMPIPTPDLHTIPVAVVPTPAVGEPSALAKTNTTIFSGPGNEYVVYSAFLSGSTARVTGVNADRTWWVINVPPAPDEQGWIAAEALTVSNADSVPVIAAPPVPPSADLVPPGPDDPQASASVNVHVRTGPGQNFPSYGIAKASQSGRLLGKSEDGLWWVVRLDPSRIGAGHGWVMAEFTQAINTENLMTIASPPAPTLYAPPPPAPGAPTVTSTDNLNVRSGPGYNFPVLFVAPPGSTGETTGKSSDGAWWQVKIAVEYSSDGLGWVSADFVTSQNTQNVAVISGPAAPPVVEATPPPSGIEGCSLAAQQPADGTVFNPGTAFQAGWVLQNTSGTRWDMAEYDVRFVGAAGNLRLHQGSDLYDLPSSVDPGGTTYIILPMIAPFDPGTYGELWQIALGNQAVCQFYVYIEVR